MPGRAVGDKLFSPTLPSKLGDLKLDVLVHLALESTKKVL